MKQKPRPRFKLILIICLGISASLLSIADEAPVVILNDPRTAAELPTKRKLPTDQAVEVNRKESDRQIQNRLNRIAQSQDIFQKVKVGVIEGIVTLKGEVEEEAYAKSFSALSEKVEGVIGVVDALKITDEKKTGLRLAQSEVDDLVHKFFKFIPYLLSCFFILLMTVILGYGIYRLWSAILSRKLTDRPLLVPHVSKLLTAPIYLLGIYLILQVGGAAGLAATLVGGTGVIGIILGLAGKNILENLLSSFMLTLRNPFKIGDDVTIGDQSGVVYRMDSRCTMLLTYDGVFTQIPNSTVLAAIIKNISAHPVNRISFAVEVDLMLSFSRFKKFFEQTIQLNEKSILADPKAKTVITGITDGKTTIQCTFWVDTNQANASEVKSNVLHSILHFLNEDTDTLTEVKESIRSGEAEPTEKKILSDRSAQVHLPSI